MKIFYMFGRFTQNGKWQTEEELPDFAGCIMQKDNSDEFIGYQNELYCLDVKEVKQMSKLGMCSEEAAGGGTRFRFIRGFYNTESNQLLFLKLTPSVMLDPLLYVFQDVKKEGLWSALDPITKKFFSNSTHSDEICQVADGTAIISIEEVTDEKVKIRRSYDIKFAYEELSKKEHPMNKILINHIEEYKKFWKYDFN